MSSCALLETDPVIIPAYIYVPKVGFHTINDNIKYFQGDSSSKFVDVWIYSNGKSLGNIGLINTNYGFKPVLIPIQSSGMNEVQFDAGITKSGQTDTRLAYPFIERQTFYRQLTPNKVDTFFPVFKYLSNTVVDKNLCEDFETGVLLKSFYINTLYNKFGDTIIFQPDSSTVYTSIKLGKNSGKVIMNPASEFFELYSIAQFKKEDLQNSPSAPVYLEMDYKSDVSILVGMKALDPNNVVTFIPEFNTNPTTFWNKVYVCLDQDITPTMAGTTFVITVRIFKDAGVTPNIWIDNIKLVHF